MRKEQKLGISALVLLVGLVAIFYRNVELRTAFFRSFAKGNWYITSEADTLYTFGYYGVKKYLCLNSNELSLLAENNKFCTNTNIGRGGAIYGDYIFVATRSYLGGEEDKMDEDYINGSLLVLRKSDLTIVSKYISDIKLVGVNIHGKCLVISGLKGFNIYDVTIPEDPKVIFTYRHPKYKEYQDFDFVKKDDKLYVAFTLFGEGLEIWDITQPNKAKAICTIPINKQMADGNDLPGGQSMDVVVNYPYLYATLGPSSETFKTEKDRRGILVYDISNINDVKKSAVLIPKTDWYNKKTGDRQPTYLTQYKNSLYVNFAEKGVAVFDISDHATPRYKGTTDISGEGALIQPIYATEKGKLFMGSYYWSTIYCSEIDKNENLSVKR